MRVYIVYDRWFYSHTQIYIYIYQESYDIRTFSRCFHIRMHIVLPFLNAQRGFGCLPGWSKRSAAASRARPQVRRDDAAPPRRDAAVAAPDASPSAAESPRRRPCWVNWRGRKCLWWNMIQWDGIADGRRMQTVYMDIYGIYGYIWIYIYGMFVSFLECDVGKKMRCLLGEASLEILSWSWKLARFGC